METLWGSVKLVSLDGTDIQQYNERLKTLLLCVEGTMPGSRAFGLRMDFLDMPTYEAANMLAAELQDKVDRYIPEISIAEVRSTAEVTGEMGVEILIERREGTE